MDIQRWFAIDSPKEMSEVFTRISALYYIAEISGLACRGSTAIECRLDELKDASEWFATCMYVEDLRWHHPNEVRWTPPC